MQSHNIQITPVIQKLDIDGQIINEITIPPEPGMDNIEVIIRNPGEPEYTVIRPFQSWVENFARYFCNTLTGMSVVTTLNNMKSYQGAAVQISQNQCPGWPFFLAAAGSTACGIIIGASGGSTSATAYCLRSPIWNGITVTALQYGTQVIDAPVQVGPNLHKLSYRRTFTNGSTSAQTIREVGLFAQNAGAAAIGVVSWRGPFMFSRDDLDATGTALALTVATGGAVEIRYNFYLDGNAGMQFNFLKQWYSGSISSNIAIPSVNNQWGSSGNTFQIVCNPVAGTAPGNMMFSFDSMAGAAAEYGIVCGASATPTLSSNDYTLDSEYREGAAFGKLNYQATAVPNMSSYHTGVLTSSTGSLFYMQRQVINNSGFNQTIREVGIYACGDITKARSISGTFMWYRKPISDIVLANGQSALIGFTFQFPI